MKAICAAFGLAAMCAVGLGAQSATTKSKTKVEVKDGKEITVSGCLERNPGGGYMLTTTNGSLKYALVTDDDLSKHLGHRVEIKGGDMSGMHYLGMKSLKMISTSCM